MRKNFKFIIAMLTLVFCLTAIAFGQEANGTIEGIVKDAAGAVVPNVTVTIKSSTNLAGSTSTTGIGQGFNRTITTDSDGFFRLIQVPPGAYVVTTGATSGFGGSTYENVQVVVGKVTQLSIEVKPGVSAVVNVGSTDAPVDTTSSEIATSIPAQKLALIPKGRDFTSALKAAPGTRPDTFAGGWTVDGASSAENIFYIDGQEVTNYKTAGINANNMVPFQLIQELQVKASGFDAEYGGAIGGVFSVITKGGSDQFHGEFGTSFRLSKFDGNPRPSQLRFTSGSGASFVQTVEYYNQPKPNYLLTAPTANLSGPIIKNRVWFFGSWSPAITEQTTNTTFFTNVPAATRTINTSAGNGGFETYHTQVIQHYGFARIDAQPFSKLRVTGTYLWNPVVTKGVIPFNPSAFGSSPAVVDFGGTIGVLKGNDLYSRQGGRNNANNVTTQAVYSPLKNLVVSFRYGRGFLNERGNNYFIPTGNQYSCNYGNSGSTTFPGACNTGYVSASTTVNLRDVSVRTNYEGDATFSFNAGGRHQLKGGYQHTGIFNDIARGFAQIVFLAYGDYRINNSGLAWSSTATPNPAAIGAGALERLGTVGKGSNLAQSIYLQDKWQPTQRLTLNLGLRIEKEDVPSMNQWPSGYQWGWGTKIGPRLGFAYDLTGKGKTKIFASYGKFYDRIKFIVAQGSFGGDFYRVDFFDILPTSGPFTNFTTAAIHGTYGDPIGGACPPTGFIAPPALSRCQYDYRVASNDPTSTPEDSGAIDPKAKPFSQREITGGLEHEFMRNYVFRGRFTDKKVLHAIDDAGAINAAGSEVYITGNPGEGLHAQFLQNYGYAQPYWKPERRYDAMEITLEKRLSNNYYFNANYTLSRLFGNYSGTANTDETSGSLNGVARSNPGVNRSFDLPFIGGTAEGHSDRGRLATDRPHVFNAYGAYIFDWRGSKTNSTELSFFQTIQSGTPQTTLVTFFAATIFTKRGDLGRTPTFSQTDFGVTHRYRFGRDNRFTLVGNVNILNLFDQKAVIGLQTTKTNGSMGFSPWPCATYPQYYVLVAGSCTGAAPNYVPLINDYNKGLLLTSINTYLAGTPTALSRTLATYGRPNRYQDVRQFTFGFNLQF